MLKVADAPPRRTRRDTTIPTVGVRLAEDVYELVRILVGYTGQTMTDALGDILRPALTKRVEKEQAEYRKRTEARSAPSNS